MLNLINDSDKKTTEEKAKVQRVDANWDINMKGNKLVITATIELDLSNPETLAMLKGLKPSDSGKSYCMTATPTPKDFCDSIKGNVLLNIPKDAMLPLQQLVEQKSKKNASK